MMQSSHVMAANSFYQAEYLCRGQENAQSASIE